MILKKTCLVKVEQFVDLKKSEISIFVILL
jgi:hypothetical protein